jgi:cytochrome c oxidase assembly factor CtaG
MTIPAADARPVLLPAWVRPALAATAGVLFLVVLVPPMATEAGRYEYLEAVRFSILAVVVPALLVLGAPWQSLHLSGPSAASSPEESRTAGQSSRPMDRLAAGRRRHLGLGRSIAILLLEMVLVVAGRTPLVVDALAGHSWLVPLEAVCLVVCGVALWLELVESPPVVPRLTRPKRIAIAAVAMWTIWTSAYLVGLSQTSVYGHYQGLTGGGLSFASDQEIGTFVLWFAAAAAFVPVVFWNLVTWLRAEEDPDEGLHRLVRENRRRTWGPSVDGTPVAQRRSGGAG